MSHSSEDVDATLLHFFQSLATHAFSDNDQNISPSPSISSLNNLLDGIILCDLLHWCEPSYFDNESIQRSSSSPSMIEGNLSTLCFGLESFFEDTIGKTMNLDSLSKDIIAVSATAGGSEINSHFIRLLELIVVCGINSQKKDEIINIIMAMTEEQQAELMHLINAVMSSDKEEKQQELPDTLEEEGGEEGLDLTDGEVAANKSDRRDSDILDRSTLPAAVNEKKLKKLEDTVSEMEIEKAYLTQQIDNANRELRELRKINADLTAKYEGSHAHAEKLISNAVTEALAQAEKQNTELRKSEMTKAQKEVQALESRLNDYQLQLKKLQETNSALHRERLTIIEQLDQSKQELIHYKDELHLAETKVEQLAQMEAKVSRLQQRLEGQSDMKAQMEAYEDQASKYMAKIIELEKQLNEVTILKSQLSKQKENVLSLQSQIVDLKASDEHSKTELIDAKNQLSSAKEEIKSLNDNIRVLKNERDTLQAKIKENLHSQSLGASLSSALSPSHTSSHELKEKLTRLELENMQLKASHSAPSADMIELKSELEMAKSIAASNEERYLNAQRKIAQLESALRQSQEKYQSSGGESSIEKEKAAEAASEELSKLRQELINAEETIVALKQAAVRKTSDAGIGAEKDKTISDLTQKNENLLVRNKKLEAFVRSAQKKVKESQEQSTTAQAANTELHDTIKLLQAQIEEKNRELKEKEKIRLDEMHATNRERRLLSAAFYSLGTEYHAALVSSKAAPKGPYASTVDRVPSKSWLSQQRSKAINDA